MRFLIDECTGTAVANWLQERGFDVLDARRAGPGTNDLDWLRMAVAEDRILITNDKDFGDAVYRDHLPHAGIVLLRLIHSTPASRVAAVERVIQKFGDSIVGRFVVVSGQAIRFAGPRRK